MDYNFTSRVSRLKASTIREMLKAQGPDVVSLSAGSPSPETFPVKEMQAISNEIFETQYVEALQYSITEGYGPLRELTKARIKKNLGIGSVNDDLIIISGGQQGIELTAKMLVNEGDTVACEEPTFIGGLNSFRSYNAKLAGVPVDEQGMKLDVLENILKTDSRVKLIYTIPTFHNPTGVTMSLSRRKQLIDLAVRYDIPVIEDDPYCELRYAGENLPTLKSLDDTGHIIYLGSYSKIISPGIRIGFACAQKDLIAKMTVLKQVSDVHSNLFFQILIAKFIEKYDIETHVALCREYGAKKLNRALSQIEKSFPDFVTCTRPEGGLFIWCDMPEGTDSIEFAKLAIENKVAVVHGSTFLTDENAVSNGFRMNFTMPDLTQIDRGMDILGDTLRQFVR